MTLIPLKDGPAAAAGTAGLAAATWWHDLVSWLDVSVTYQVIIGILSIGILSLTLAAKLVDFRHKYLLFARERAAEAARMASRIVVRKDCGDDE